MLWFPSGVCFGLRNRRTCGLLDSRLRGL